jgi:hypothetical protein
MMRILRELRSDARRVALWWHDTLGPAAEAGAVLVVGIVFLVAIEEVPRLADHAEWSVPIAELVILVASVFVLRRAARHHRILAELTLSYVMQGGRGFQADLLGKLIGGLWKSDERRSGEHLFASLARWARDRDWALRREVAEAIPALAEIDARQTLKLVYILRDDWEADRWYADLRRRAVEGLITPVAVGRAPLLDRLRRGDVRPLLHLRERDDIWTAMAVVEALDQLDRRWAGEATDLFHDLFGWVSKTLPEAEHEAVWRLRELLELARTSRPHTIAERLDAFAASGNELIRVVACRHCLVLASRMPQATLRRLAVFARDPHRYVHRAAARDVAVEFVIEALRWYPTEARQLLVALAGDAEAIVRASVFDKMEMVRSRDEALARQMCGQIVRFPDPPVVVARAQEILGDGAARPA